MGKIKKFPHLNIRKITGGKHPLKIVEEFILRRGFDPEECLQDKSQDHQRWMLSLGGGEEFEILVEELRTPTETTIYLGLNVVVVPLRGAHDMLVAALEVADGLVGVKVSLVGHYLVLSSSLAAVNVSVEELDYCYNLIVRQKTWFSENLVRALEGTLPSGDDPTEA